MGLINEILNKFNKQSKNINPSQQELENHHEEKETFLADISLHQLKNADWEKFGSILKQNKILPNSYIKQPTAVEIKTTTNARPMVLLTFNSSTSNSVRRFKLLQDGAFQYINGTIDDGKNQELLNIWNKFKDEIRYLYFLNTNREETLQTLEANRTIKTAERTINTLKNLYNQEQAFLEKYKDFVFHDFNYRTLILDDGAVIRYGELPQFTALKRLSNVSIDGERVLPFTPKTLEFCILRMTNCLKIEEGEQLENFEKKCRQIQAFSGYESEDWGNVIEIGKNIVKKQYQSSVITNDYEERL